MSKICATLFLVAISMMPSFGASSRISKKFALCSSALEYPASLSLENIAPSSSWFIYGPLCSLRDFSQNLLKLGRACRLLKGPSDGDRASLKRHKRQAMRRRGRGLAFSLTATAQTRTHKTAGANNEIIPRGGASAWVLKAKPSPFLIFCGVWRENRRTWRFARSAFTRKRLKFREPKICKKRVENLVTKRILFNTTF